MSLKTYICVQKYTAYIIRTKASANLFLNVETACRNQKIWSKQLLKIKSFHSLEREAFHVADFISDFCV